jgi:hypothetical protein
VLDGVDGLRAYLLSTRRDDFVRQFCRKLLGFGLGRAIQLSDELLLDKMQAELSAKDFRIASAVETIVTSRQFREIRASETRRSNKDRSPPSPSRTSAKG